MNSYYSSNRYTEFHINYISDKERKSLKVEYKETKQGDIQRKLSFKIKISFKTSKSK